jgi:hypothetical protein
MRFTSLSTIALVLLTISLVSSSAARAQSTTSPADDLRTWFKELSDQSPDVRERARLKLMTMPRSRLTELRRVVAGSHPLTAAQAAELRAIVEHVFLSGESYLTDDAPRGFIGVELTSVAVPELETQSVRDVSDVSRERVMITRRIPGFPAYPLLRDGDVVLAVVGSNMPLGDQRSLPAALAGARPGMTIELEIQRAGKVIRVPIRLSRRPSDSNMSFVEGTRKFTAERQQAADDYWEANFAELIDQQTL